MSRKALERLLDCLGQIEDLFITEAETTNMSRARSDKRKRAAKYGAYGAAGLAVLGGAAAAYWRIRASRAARSA